MVSIIGLGESAIQYNGKGDTIGVNDAWKFHKTKVLLCADPMNRFTTERKRTIQESAPELFVTYSREWLQYFTPNYEKIKPSLKYKELYFSDGRKVRFAPWKGEVKEGIINYSLTSPFIAISLAHYMGYKEIVLWGVDFKTHKSYKPGTSGLEIEKKNYKELITALAGIGVSVRHGVKGSEIEI